MPLFASLLAPLRAAGKSVLPRTTHARAPSLPFATTAAAAFIDPVRVWELSAAENGTFTNECKFELLAEQSAGFKVGCMAAVGDFLVVARSGGGEFYIDVFE